MISGFKNDRFEPRQTEPQKRNEYIGLSNGFIRRDLSLEQGSDASPNWPSGVDASPDDGTPGFRKGSNPSGADETAVYAAYGLRRETAYRLRTGHRRLISDLHPSLAHCGIGHIPVREVGQNTSATLTYRTDDRTGLTRATVQGLTRCASPWACPRCSPIIAADRTRSLAPQVTGLIAQGWSSWSFTLTLRHDRTTTLADAIVRAKGTWEKLASGRWWNALRRLGRFEFVRGYDITWGPTHGWHVHLHVVIVWSSAHGNGEASSKSLLDRWIVVAKAQGLHASMQGQKAFPTLDPIRAMSYVVRPAAAYSRQTANERRQCEATSGMAPFEILADAVGEPDDDHSPGRARALWRVYVAATKGLRQCGVSRGLHLVDEEHSIDGVEESGSVVVATLGSETVRELDSRQLTPSLLALVEVNADRDDQLRFEVCRFLHLSILAEDWRMVSAVVVSGVHEVVDGGLGTHSGIEDLMIDRPSAANIVDEAHRQRYRLQKRGGRPILLSNAIMAVLEMRADEARQSGRTFVPPSMRELLQAAANDKLH